MKLNKQLTLSSSQHRAVKQRQQALKRQHSNYHVLVTLKRKINNHHVQGDIVQLFHSIFKEIPSLIYKGFLCGFVHHKITVSSEVKQLVNIIKVWLGLVKHRDGVAHEDGNGAMEAQRL